MPAEILLEVKGTLTMTGRKGISVAAHVKQGQVEGRVLLQSQQFGDTWHVREMVLYGAGIEYQEKRKNGGRIFYFEAIGSPRDINQGELFHETSQAKCHQQPDRI